MEIDKTKIIRYRDGILTCTRIIERYKDRDILPAWLDSPYFQDVDKKAAQLFDYIVNNNDKEMAKVLAAVSRYNWRYLASFCDTSCDVGMALCRKLTTVLTELYRIHNWYLETVWRVPVEEIHKYYVSSKDGRVYDRNTKEELTKPLMAEERCHQSEATDSKSMPKELQTDDAKALFGRLVNEGFCSPDGGLYKWKGTMALWGYFVEEASDSLGVRPSNDNKPWALFARAFTDITKRNIDTAKNYVAKSTHICNNGIREWLKEPKGSKQLGSVIYPDYSEE